MVVFFCAGGREGGREGAVRQLCSEVYETGPGVCQVIQTAPPPRLPPSALSHTLLFHPVPQFSLQLGSCFGGVFLFCFVLIYSQEQKYKVSALQYSLYIRTQNGLVFYQQSMCVIPLHTFKTKRPFLSVSFEGLV